MFYAIKFEDSVKEQLAKNLTEVRKHAPKGNFTEKDNFHVTLAFVGECEASQLGNLKKAADNAVANLNPPPAKATIQRLGTFARPGDELLWAGVKTEPENFLETINKAIVEELAKFKIRPQRNDKFHPHVTIARKVEFYESSNEALAKIKFAPIDFRIDSITLMESVQETKTYGERRHSRIIYKPVHETKFQITQISL
jgi:2'-5' RNA ligase